MSDEKRLIGDVKRAGTLVYELAMTDGPRGRQVEVNRWVASVSSGMRACTEAECEQIAERIRVSINAFDPMRRHLNNLRRVLDAMHQPADTPRDPMWLAGMLHQARAEVDAGLRAADGATEGR